MFRSGCFDVFFPIVAKNTKVAKSAILQDHKLLYFWLLFLDLSGFVESCVCFLLQDDTFHG